jgi:NADH-quinone oxidoreductase subunit L
MIARLHPLYVLAPAALEVVAVVGTLTALLAAVIATAQVDIKKVLAYSTVSQLGLMFLALGVGATAAGVFHLVTHAFFKALLFLGAGSVIHGLGGEQDLRRMGGLRHAMPITFVTMAVATLAIAGVPPFSGFFSKDEIVWGAFATSHAVLGVLAMVVSFLTAYYTGRLLCMAFFGTSRAQHDGHEHHAHESPGVMAAPLAVLAVLAAGGGWLPVPAILERAHLVAEPEGPAAPLWMFGLASAVALAGLALAWQLYVVRPELPAVVAERLDGFYALVRDKFRVDELYDATIVRLVFGTADVSARRIDPGVIDGAVNGAGLLVAATGGAWRRLQTGNVQHYALSFLVGALVLLVWFVSP